MLLRLVFRRFPLAIRRKLGYTVPIFAGVMELADVTDSKCLTPHTVQNPESLVAQGFSKTKNLRFSGLASILASKFRKTSSSILTLSTYAGVVELADARDSKSRVRKDVRVRPPPPAPSESPESLDFTGFSGLSLFCPEDGACVSEAVKNGKNRVSQEIRIPKSLVLQGFSGSWRPIRRPISFLAGEISQDFIG